ncbi:hypothetical protein HanRHA438_Chr17g0824691 [Helianthus annuus]|nr:hypothetical protein HanRHA438_Chr17g0824691 [Helianthus annuus]
MTIRRERPGLRRRRSHIELRRVTAAAVDHRHESSCVLPEDDEDVDEDGSRSRSYRRRR